MKFLLDACAASRTLHKALIDLGHDVLSAREGYSRATDEALLAVACKERRVLIAEDKDFGELVFLRRLPHPCIVRLIGLRVTEKVDAMRNLIERHGDAIREDAVVVVTGDGCGYDRRVPMVCADNHGGPLPARDSSATIPRHSEMSTRRGTARLFPWVAFLAACG